MPRCPTFHSLYGTRRFVYLPRGHFTIIVPKKYKICSVNSPQMAAGLLTYWIPLLQLSGSVLTRSMDKWNRIFLTEANFEN